MCVCVQFDTALCCIDDNDDMRGAGSVDGFLRVCARAVLKFVCLSLWVCVYRQASHTLSTKTVDQAIAGHLK